MSKAIIDLSIAGIVDLNNLGYDEEETVTFTATEPWPDEYVLNVYNSPVKNTPVEIPGALTKGGNDLTIALKPKTQQIPVGDNYYEIFNTTTKRVEFKGDLKVIK
jgi:hypothetical protein